MSGRLLEDAEAFATGEVDVETFCLDFTRRWERERDRGIYCADPPDLAACLFAIYCLCENPPDADALRAAVDAELSRL